MTETAGSIVRDFMGFFIQKTLTKSNTAVTKGQVLIEDTGWALCAAASAAGLICAISMSTEAAVTATQVAISIFRFGAIWAAKATGTAIADGTIPTFANSGEFSTGGNAAANAEVVEAALSAATSVYVMIK